MTITKKEALEVLGLANGASAEEIKKAYRKKALETHPDKTIFPEGATDALQKELTDKQSEKFKKVSDAYQLLSDPEKFKASQNAGHGANGFMRPEDLFSRFFGAAFEDFFMGGKPGTSKKKIYIRMMTSQGTRHSSDLHIAVDSEDELAKECNIRFSNVTRLSIFDVHLKKSPNSSQIILDALIKNPHIKRVDSPPAFFNAAQTAALKKHLNQNSSKGLFKFTLKNCLAVLALAAAYVAGFGFTGMAVAFVGVQGVISLYNMMQENYMQFAKRQYPNAQKIGNVSDPSEIAALKCGVFAKDWSGYFASFKAFSTYRHPLAFRAGMKYACDENEANVRKINSLN